MSKRRVVLGSLVCVLSIGCGSSGGAITADVADASIPDTAIDSTNVDSSRDSIAPDVFVDSTDVIAIDADVPGDTAVDTSRDVIDVVIDACTRTCYYDVDGDGRGGIRRENISCDDQCPAVSSSVEVAIGGDCDESDPTRFMFAPEKCDGIDQSCDGLADIEPGTISDGGDRASSYCYELSMRLNLGYANNPSFEEPRCMYPGRDVGNYQAVSRFICQSCWVNDPPSGVLYRCNCWDESGYMVCPFADGGM